MSHWHQRQMSKNAAQDCVKKIKKRNPASNLLVEAHVLLECGTWSAPLVLVAWPAKIEYPQPFSLTQQQVLL